ncbi:hypothetical protein EN749_21610 [Mesorhizobium sp. M7A.F.Ca.ET.027.02.1.1]|uniref:hypothetical protein n=1 Tax=Mesorhizobium sp. M7A.F.Ca.ET.027.02.1.1 TaxID=2496655 RepID=UPI000FD60B91|nr:hypothetical protein [Mesorhizobium sp. M7A.F.Ca.ET.027.02.1.1]RVD13950.1 hypothetical protein EN749_21610 [Mesorhizobium sp. M7A.F.Ca.ET.027.02.1.1]
MITYQQPPIGTLSNSPVINQSIVERMADRVLELGMNGTAVTKDVLAEHTDFTRAEIDQYAPDACDLAKSRAVRQQS